MNTDIGYTRSIRYVYTGAELVDGWAIGNYAVVPACILNPASTNLRPSALRPSALRQSMAYVEEVSE